MRSDQEIAERKQCKYNMHEVFPLHSGGNWSEELSIQGQNSLYFRSNCIQMFEGIVCFMQKRHALPCYS